MSKASVEFVTGTFEELVEKSTSENTDVRFLAAARIMNSDDEPDPRALPVLISLMKDASHRVRTIASLGLGHYEDIQAKAVLIDHLQNDTNAHVRTACVTALSNIGGTDNELITALSDMDADVRVMAAIALSNISDADSASHLISLLDDPEWNVRYNACLSLLNLGVSNKKIIDTISALRGIPEACEAVVDSADYDVIFKVSAEFADEWDQLDDEFNGQERVDMLRARHGEEAVPYPSPDPLGDLIERAMKIAEKSP